MNKVRDFLVSPDTRVFINISTLLFVIGFTITWTYIFTTEKTKIEMTQNQIIVDQGKIGGKIDSEIEDRKLADIEILKEVKTTEALLLETQTSLTDIDIKVETGFARIYTSLEWIINALRKDK